MKEHPHLHCIMPGGGLSFDREHWVHVPDRNKFFIAGKVMANKFRGKFLDMLKVAHGKGELEFHGQLATIKGTMQFNRFLTPIYQKKWVVNVQNPMGSPELMNGKEKVLGEVGLEFIAYKLSRCVSILGCKNSSKP